MDIKSSPLVKGALEAKRSTRWYLAWLIVVPIFIILPVVGIPSAIGLVWTVTPGSFQSQLIEILTNGVSLILLATWVIFKERRPFSSVGFRGPHKASRVLIGLLGGIAVMSAIAFAFVATGYYQFSTSGSTVTRLSTLLPVLFVAVVVQATAEETLTRGYLLQVTGLQIPAWPTVILVSFGFAVIHLNFNPIVLLNITLVALFFSFISLAQGSIWAAIGFHIGWNYAQGNLLGIPVSGAPRDVALLALSPAPDAPAWLTGGSFGIEGSVAASIVLAVLAIGSLTYYRRVEVRRRRGGQANA